MNSTLDEEISSYHVIPANKTSDTQITKTTVISTPGTPAHKNQVMADAIAQQHIQDSKYDNTDDITVKPLYGGNNKKNNKFKYYKIRFNNKLNKYKAHCELDAITMFLNKNKLKNDYLLDITEYNKNTKKEKEILYLIKIK